MKNAYAILGVPQGADEDTIKKAYRAKARMIHPDRIMDPALKLQCEELFKDVAAAYTVLTDPKARHDLDEHLTRYANTAFVPAQPTTNTTRFVPTYPVGPQAAKFTPWAAAAAPKVDIKL